MIKREHIQTQIEWITFRNFAPTKINLDSHATKRYKRESLERTIQFISK